MRVILYCLLVLLGCSSTLHATPLLWGYSPSDPPPYVALSGVDLQPSLTRELGELVGEYLNRPVTFIALPNNRIDEALDSGRIHLICNTQPEWHSKPTQLYWSEVLYDDADVVATAAGKPAPDSLSSLQGALVGTTFGYHYSSALTAAFAQGALTRHDVRDIQTRLKMLERGRLDASIDLRRALRHHLRITPAAITVSDWELERFYLRCAAPKRRPGSEQLINAIDQLLSNGQIQQLLQRYE
ncbi:substrate-binding periplasmic protein [Halopseudomonas maritima]|uniref:substrate-binding periplasmic protein n=1 Tax=Halopseudomonas maritima TaxID=2918528 RepID=UPI001EEC1852|nr:transporter substrate-binding domain-containing protein [Halopseudomonas maritima]UJJ32183.1 transporter substrate-binding domain-containing protein [Halopseudomonas maritima]